MLPLAQPFIVPRAEGRIHSLAIYLIPSLRSYLATKKHHRHFALSKVLQAELDPACLHGQLHLSLSRTYVDWYSLELRPSRLVVSRAARSVDDSSLD